MLQPKGFISSHVINSWQPSPVARQKLDHPSRCMYKRLDQIRLTLIIVHQKKPPAACMAQPNAEASSAVNTSCVRSEAGRCFKPRNLDPSKRQYPDATLAETSGTQSP